MADIDGFFNLMHREGASDLHLVSGHPPAVRIRGDIVRVKYDHPLEDEELKKLLYEITPEHKIKEFEETGDTDFGYEILNVARYRANLFRHEDGVGAVFREIPNQI